MRKPLTAVPSASLGTRRAHPVALPVLLALLALLIVTALLSIGNGAYPLSVHDIVSSLLSPSEVDRTVRAVVVDIRLPRVLLGVVSGAALGAAGAALQAIFRNPLADPGLIGVSSGAALGAAIAIVAAPALGLVAGGPLVSLAAFAASLLVTALVYRLGGNGQGVMLHWLLLAGIAINAIVGALIGLLTYVASDAQLRSLTFWSLGSLGGANWRMLAWVTPMVALACTLLLHVSPMLTVLQLGEHEAAHLGIPVQRLKQAVLLACALAVGAVVSCTGIIGFIGLVAPHCIRLVCGPHQRIVLPGAMLLGAWLTVAADLAARTLAAPAEIPLGILTALLGAPFFLMLLRQRKRAAG